MIIAIGSDHGGFLLKENIKKHLISNEIKFLDFGTHTDKNVDYPRYAYEVACCVSEKKCNLGILCCGTGIGISIAANKVKNIRAALCYDETCVKLAREHNDANILCLGGKITDPKKAISLTKIFLETSFEKGRHQNRLNQISEIENRTFKLTKF